MKQIFAIIFLVFLWIVSFVNPSGWALANDFPHKMSWVITAIAVIIYMKNRTVERFHYQTKSNFWGLVITFIAIPFLSHKSWDGATYMVAFLIVYILSYCQITDKVIRYSSWIIAALGLGVMFIYTKASVLSGWNDNAISMVGLFSFIYFSIYLVEKKGKRIFWFWNIVTVVYLILLFSTRCRSGALFSSFTVIAIVYSYQTKKLLYNNKVENGIMIFPFLVVAGLLFLMTLPIYHQLDLWSMHENNKPFANGRDELWPYCLELLAQSYYLGVGEFKVNYHNSCLAALSVFGIAGFYFWVRYFKGCMKAMRDYLNDKIVFGTFLGFVMIYLQQSFDLGFITPFPNYLPYMILGVGLGRVRMLEEADWEEEYEISTC